MCRHLGRCGAAAIMEDDIYVLVSCWKWAPPSESFPFSVALFVYYAAAGGAAGLNLAICGTAGYLKKSQYLHGNNSSSVPPKTTFGDEANNILSACWQKSREMVYEGPREGSQAKPQHFPQTAPLVLFLLLAVVVVTLTRPLICTQTPFRSCSVKFTAPIKCRKCRWGWCEKEEEDGKTVWNERDDMAGNQWRQKHIVIMSLIWIACVFCSLNAVTCVWHGGSAWGLMVFFYHSSRKRLGVTAVCWQVQPS